MTGTVPARITLHGRHVRLEPLELEHHSELCDVGLDPALWTWTMTHAHDPAQLHEYLNAAIQERERGTAIPFTIRDATTGRAIGSTRFGNIDMPNRKLEIGWTWIGTAWQRSAANTETKLLLLTHAFETLGCIRVELKTDVLNQRSRDAIARIGATQEGIFRKHAVTSTGRIRDTAYYSIIDDEWPAVKVRLQERLT